ncbi:hypothetical protein BK049_13680 [Bacillus xiamenensis]|uniref:M protein repeat family protein n=1 Tax=Bacillus xiamenensis TaxID=1178537 RepID=A0AAC9IMD0_9BACI|nr:MULTISPECIES: hypothetical protein [Bacillus]AOZ89638.1 hypothetical protein BK049_13680 [Bacillus xiamenensis]EKF33783.1 hypothetical protein BA1_18202 [Bacillus xiamenensis]MBG9910388.1 m protein repeat family protein [Bacillus xiamenensis]MCW1838252.1 hypothetical protein [Bacillus xiamenensis]MCY9577071.1 hypothetical protein [Bacillus xiamenensis]
MMMLLIIGLLCVCFAIGYAVNFFLLKQQNQPIFSKKLFYPFLIIGLVLSMMSLPFAVTGAQKAQADPSSEQLLKDQKQLASDISRLKEDKETLTATLKDVTNEKEELSKKLENITSEKKTVKQQEKTIQALEKKIDKLTSTNETLKKENKNGNKDTQSSAVQRSAPKDDGSNTGGHESQKETKNESAACNIKGSVNGIYHTPSSRYYTRTKHVTKMFCSVEEAERAGYRAPKQ